MLQSGSVTAARPGVIWISGFSAAGKTTVGRKVEAQLREMGLSSIFLDGDDLRSIFAARWGYERADRVELARVYLRLSSHLASQGHTVVLSAVAMYDEVRRWVRDNIPGALEVYLNVPEEERRTRDKATKQIYAKVGDLSRMYDAPDDAVLQLNNSASSTPDAVAAEIVRTFLERNVSNTDFGRDKHWGSYYSKPVAPAKPSPFASEVAKSLPAHARLLEVGCGNGRDSSFFAREGHAVTAVDASAAAIELCKTAHAGSGIDFRAGKLPDVAGSLPGSYDAVYSRFVLHAMPLREEEELLRAAFGLLKAGGRIYVECRSINDPMARLGEVISPTERIHGHYRRFIVLDELRDRLSEQGFAIREEVEANGLAVHGDEDPVVIRIVAQKGD